MSPLNFFNKTEKKMAKDNHLFSVTCYNVTMRTSDYYNDFFEIGHRKLTLTSMN